MKSSRLTPSLDMATRSSILRGHRKRERFFNQRVQDIIPEIKYKATGKD